MFRQSPGRNQRSKGIKIKHVLQLCFLIAICFWLLYQVKHSHDKKKEFDESDAKVSVRTQTSNEMLKFGRKDLQQPKVDEIATTTSIINKKQNEEAEEEEEEEEKKHEEVQQEEEQKLDDKEDEEGKGVGVGEEDELPEHEIEKSDPEIDGEEDATEEEKEKESEENDNESSLDDRDDEDGSAKGTHEAREELYKADDASSAVTHETQISADETDNEDSNEHPEMDKSANETEKNTTTYSKTQEREMIENNPPLDTISKSENSSIEAQSDGPLVKNTTEVIREADGSTIQNVTVDGKPPGGGSDTENISSSSEETSSKAINSSSIVTEDNSQTSTAGSDNTIDSENLDSDAVKTENPEVVQNDPIDSSDSSVAVRTDLETLPHIQAEATTNDEDAAAE